MQEEEYNLDDMEETKRAYIAGIFDGEGYMTFNYQHGIPQPRAGMTNSKSQLLEDIKKNMGFGKIYRKDNSKTNWKDTFQFLCTNYSEVDAFLRLVFPYLTVKKELARLMLEYVESRSESRQVQIIRDPKNGRILGTKPNPLTEREKEIVELIKSKNRRGRN